MKHERLTPCNPRPRLPPLPSASRAHHALSRGRFQPFLDLACPPEAKEIIEEAVTLIPLLDLLSSRHHPLPHVQIYALAAKPKQNKSRKQVRGQASVRRAIKQLRMQHANNQCYEMHVAVKGMGSTRPVYQPAKHIKSPQYHGLSTGKSSVRDHRGPSAHHSSAVDTHIRRQDQQVSTSRYHLFLSLKTSSSNQISSRKKTLQNDTVPTYQNDAVALYQQAADLFKTTNDWFQLQHPKRSVLTSSNDVAAPTSRRQYYFKNHQQLVTQSTHILHNDPKPAVALNQMTSLRLLHQIQSTHTNTSSCIRETPAAGSSTHRLVALSKQLLNPIVNTQKR
ncbi:Fibronectin type III domain-containing protein isoform 1 [Dorcoceras hygrometricum]|uniref:Fibronectin type III domain-containing protein isoform 1 n=1 Tax=Dorcoceras hygrometricum TaxID=472368 RepID=A0A2Z7BQC7_9LAMI|nr:Fibronectin type III domain-containing protein isoform 1 [Dorcoceras hygrometricum]